MFLSDLSIKRPIMISMLLIIFLIFGSMAYFNLNLDLTPEMNIGVITIQTVYPGAGPVEIENQVTKKIEDAVSTISQIDYSKSYSMNSVSLVTIFFLLEKDVNKRYAMGLPAVLQTNPYISATFTLVNTLLSNSNKAERKKTSTI